MVKGFVGEKLLVDELPKTKSYFTQYSFYEFLSSEIPEINTLSEADLSFWNDLSHL